MEILKTIVFGASIASSVAYLLGVVDTYVNGGTEKNTKLWGWASTIFWSTLYYLS